MPKLRVFAIQIHLLIKKKKTIFIQIRLNRIGRKANKSERGMVEEATKKVFFAFAYKNV
jgi:hypothetical protein